MSRVVCALWLAAVCLCGLVPEQGFAQPQPGINADGPPPVLATEPSPLLKEPGTPEEMFDAIVLLVDLARFDIAGGYLRQFNAGNPSDALLQTLRDKHGTATFVRLTRIPALRNDALPLLDRLNAASRKQAEDPAYIDGLMDRLNGTPLDRELAVRELRNAGERAVPQILQRLATTKSDSERDQLILALTRMGQPVVPAVTAAIDSSNAVVRDGCIKVVELLEAESAVPKLWPLAVGPNIEAGTRDGARKAIARIRFGDRSRVDRLSDSLAVEELRRRVVQLLSSVTTAPDEAAAPGVEDSLTVWTWNNDEQTLTSRDVTRNEYVMSQATRSATDMFQIDPERAQIQTLYLLTMLATEVQRVGWDEVLTAETSLPMQMAVASGVETLQSVLEQAMAMGRTDAVWAALQGLSALASPELVRGQGGQSSPVFKALNFPDPRVQFAAAVALLRSDPSLKFPQGSRVVEVLRRSLRDSDAARAVIIHPDKAESATLTAYLTTQGFDPIVTATGREGFLQAAEQAGTQLVVVHANVSNWTLTQTLANLRADSRTAFLPIVVYGPDNVRGATARLIARTGNAVFVGESPAADSFWMQALPLLQQRQTPPISPQQRADFKSLAVFWLAELLTSGTASGIDLRPAAAELLPLVDDDAVALNAVVGLGQIGTAAVQSRLAEFALNERLPIETRRAAARELATHIPRFGLFLSAMEAARVTAGWERATDPELQARLAAVVGGFKPNTGLVGDRLRKLTTGP